MLIKASKMRDESQGYHLWLHLDKRSRKEVCGLESILLSGMVSIVTVIITQLIIAKKEKRQSKRAKIAQLRKEYIDPLRFAVSETYYRMYEVMGAEVPMQSLCQIDGENALPDKTDGWYAGEGCYLISSCYLTAHLFYCMEQVRSAVPFMELSSSDDTNVLGLIHTVTAEFSQFGIYYVLQRDIGRGFQRDGGGPLLSYREFCKVLQDRENLVWYAPLVRFYLGLHQANRENPRQVDRLMDSLKQLSAYLDHMAKGGKSIEKKLRVEREVHNPL